ncbi:hypothetical protein WISP_101529 [Willisornis vidua]|uniref:Endonuclease/exonuclease/phosphatase domain-containing protein n=1 Tax=Willisornis vidua TaxID=1566151 RepID=A0ABQ9D185_9PASS|nr:hypothetical protein WISP_101529 [Willisornis vidua]
MLLKNLGIRHKFSELLWVQRIFSPQKYEYGRVWMVQEQTARKLLTHKVEFICVVLSFLSLTKRSVQMTSTDVDVYTIKDKNDDTNELFFDKLRDTSKSTGLVLMEHFNLPEINWEHHTAGTTWARRFLKNLDDNFMEQVLRKATQKDALDLLLVNKEDLMNKVETGSHLGHSSHKVIEIKISVDCRKVPAKPQLWT